MMKTHLFQERQAFGEQLKTLRNQRRLTLHDLENRTGIKYSAIASIESGNRAAGEGVALRLADGLMLRDKERESFLNRAGATTVRGAFSSKAYDVGVQVMRALNQASSAIINSELVISEDREAIQVAVRLPK